MATSVNGSRPPASGPFPTRRWPPANNPERDRTISRLAVLKAAAEFAASPPDVKSGDVLAIADRWLAWVEQGGGDARDWSYHDSTAAQPSRRAAGDEFGG